MWREIGSEKVTYPILVPGDLSAAAPVRTSLYLGALVLAARVRSLCFSGASRSSGCVATMLPTLTSHCDRMLPPFLKKCRLSSL